MKLACPESENARNIEVFIRKAKQAHNMCIGNAPTETYNICSYASFEPFLSCTNLPIMHEHVLLEKLHVQSLF